MSRPPFFVVALFLGLLAASLAPSCASATPVTSASFVFLGRMTSHPGEPRDAFVFRVAGKLSSFTRETGYEGCGVLLGSVKSDAWRVYLVSRQSHLGCLTVSFEDSSFAPIGRGIHSHPQATGFKANFQDSHVYGFAVCGQGVRVKPRTFSEGDFRAGPGYLVAKSSAPFAKVQLLDQSGKGTEVSLGSVPDGDVATDPLPPSASLPVARVSDGSIAVAVPSLPTACPVQH